MRLQVPFYRQTTPLNCGTAALRMACSFLGKDLAQEQLVGIRPGQGISAIRLALAAARQGFPTLFVSTHLGFNPHLMQLPFYQQHGDTDAAAYDRLAEEARSAGVRMEERSLSLRELLGFLGESIPIVLVDWNVVRRRAGYQGHFLPVVGFSPGEVLVHQHGLDEPQAFLPVPRTTFWKAWTAEGTDQEAVVVGAPAGGTG
ncbi:MAG: peptidase C39 family protein [Candidatus Aenigmarchaeota archaeon]|nr:peptidase C39 family protein [Candidatus Aenigmarchaeota archaeon]